MNYKIRNKCAVTGKDDIEEIWTIKHFPIHMGVTELSEETDMFADMTWGISKSSGLVQLMKLIPEDILYQNGHGSGSTGKIWMEHHQCFADFIYKYKDDIKDVFEIGGGHGILAKDYRGQVNWTILEPNPSPVEGSKAKYIKGFFSEQFVYREKFDAFVHSHTFEHIYESANFMTLLSDFIPNGKYLFFSLPNIKEWFEKKFSNAINFEHTILLTEPYIDYILQKNGFKILEKEYFKDHSIFYAARRENGVSAAEKLDTGLYEKNYKLITDYVNYYKEEVDKLNKLIEETDKRIYIFGAHVFTQLLIAFGLKTDKLICVLDNDINKQGKRLIGTSLVCKSPKVLENEDEPILILKAGAYTEEIKKDIGENINSKVIFFE